MQAFTDMDDALTTWRYTTEQETLQAQAIAAAKRAADAAAAQLTAGTADVTTVLTIGRWAVAGSGHRGRSWISSRD